MSKKERRVKNRIIQGTYGAMREVEDFLPSPEELVLKKAETIKVTIELDKDSVDFFKDEADRLGGSYQRMIRNLLRNYTSNQV